MGRARNIYLEGGLTWQGFTKIKEEAEGFLASAYVREPRMRLRPGKSCAILGLSGEPHRLPGGTGA